MEWRKDFTKWCEGEIAKMRPFLERLESGNMRVGRRQFGSQWEDMTADEIARLKRSIGELEALIDRLRKEIESGLV